MNILAIDVGIINLAIIGVNLNEDYLERQEVIKEDEIFMCEKIDITELVSGCRDKDCVLYHDKIICDYMMHLFKMYKKEFDSANIILIERQPLQGIVAVQELIMREYRNKSILISPNAMLNSFGILKYEYEERKVHTIKIAFEYLSGFKNFVFNERRHDMADAICILLYYLSLKRKEYTKKIEKEENKIRYAQAFKKLSEYVYKE